jgi:hypothetical protein
MNGSGKGRKKCKIGEGKREHGQRAGQNQTKVSVDKVVFEVVKEEKIKGAENARSKFTDVKNIKNERMLIKLNACSSRTCAACDYLSD